MKAQSANAMKKSAVIVVTVLKIALVVAKKRIKIS